MDVAMSRTPKSKTPTGSTVSDTERRASARALNDCLALPGKVSDTAGGPRKESAALRLRGCGESWPPLAPRYLRRRDGTRFLRLHTFFSEPTWVRAARRGGVSSAPNGSSERTPGRALTAARNPVQARL